MRTDKGGVDVSDGCLRVRFDRGGDDVQQFARANEMLTPSGIGEQPIVANAVKPTGQQTLRVVRCLPSRAEVRRDDDAARAGVVQASREETAACPGEVRGG